MEPSARISVLTGPERGRNFDMLEETILIGKDPSAGLPLTDPLLEGRLIHITRRQGRHAIYVTGTDEVEVAGTRVPPEKWVWLPVTANLQLTRRTCLEFQSLQNSTDVDYDTAIPSSPGMPARKPEGANAKTNGNGQPASETARSPAPTKKGEAKPGGKAKPTVARFITDQAGDPLVRLGEDGHFPELQLQDTKAKSAEADSKNANQETNSTTLIAIFLASMGMSFLMLFADFGTSGSTASKRDIARQVLPIFYGTDGDQLLPYQSMLRRAAQAQSQGHSTLEHQIYVDVLKLLRAENKNPVTGVTRLTPDAQRKFEALTLPQLKTLATPTEQFLDLKNDERLARLLSILIQ